ncbi:PLP-dependent aminotransferase family protein [Thalassobacillus devorans]|uniref:MocR-like transcriptional regulator GabR n=1 Tax=Thalassobacillus devorans TaxID=279813 RepID=UPI0004B41BF2|nr:PLP-dependent aminotransferase family protein [Thalassobacillus devorans]
MFFQIKKGDEHPAIYKQIYTQLKDLILEEALTERKLPSKRKLAQDLGVSVNSVAHAYEQLLAEGYIYSVERKGYMVEDITRYIKKDWENDPFPEELKENGKQESFQPEVTFSHIATDAEHFPFKKWRRYQQNVINHHKKQLSILPHPQGPYELRQSIATMIALTRGVRCRPEQIIIGSGTQPLIHKLMSLQPRSTTIAVENPGYQRFYQLLKDMDFTVEPIDLDDQGISVEAFTDRCPKWVFVTPSHQFPTGTIMPINRRIKLLNWAAESPDRYIVEDDYDSEFKYETDHIPSLQSLDRNRQVIYTGTFSKTLLPSLRISYMVLPPDLLKRYRNAFSHWIDGPSGLNLWTLKYFIDKGEYSRHIKRMNARYKTKRAKLIHELRRVFADKITIHDIPAGLHFLVEIDTSLSYQDIEEQAKERKIELYTIRRFFLQNINMAETDKKKLIIGFANMKEEKIRESVERLASLFS